MRWQLEGAIQVLVAALVLWVALAAGGVDPWNIPIGRIVRWAALALLAAAAVGYALTRRPRRAAIGTGTALAALLALALLTLALLSTLWSPFMSLTLGRAASLLALFTAVCSIAYGAQGRQEAAGQALLGVLAGAVAVAILGLLNLWADPDRAIVPATAGSPARYNGLGGNPNMMPMLLALALPLAAWAFVEARSRWGKAAAVGTFLLFDLSIAASGSRGALLAACAGLLALAPALAGDRRRRLALAAGAVALLAANLALTEIPPNAERDPAILNPAFGEKRPIAPSDLEADIPLQSEIGFPAPGSPAGERELLQSSGRTEAWRGALEQAGERPLVGYGFGTEERVFVDRYYVFTSDRVENSFLGLLLQLGAIGVALVLVLLSIVVAQGWRVVNRPQFDGRLVAGACLSVVAAGIVLALTQSFMTSVGSPPTAPFWLAAALLTALVAASRERAPA